MSLRTLLTLAGAIALVVGCSKRTSSSLDQVDQLLFAGKLSAALARCDQFLSAHPEDHRAWLLRGQINQEAGHLDQALVDFSRAIKLQPDNAECYFYRDRLLDLRAHRRSTRPDHRRDNSVVKARDHAPTAAPPPPTDQQTADATLTAVQDTAYRVQSTEDLSWLAVDVDSHRDADVGYSNKDAQSQNTRKQTSRQQKKTRSPALPYQTDDYYWSWLAEQERAGARVFDPSRSSNSGVPQFLFDVDHELTEIPRLDPDPRPVTRFGYQLGQSLPTLPRSRPATTGIRSGILPPSGRFAVPTQTRQAGGVSGGTFTVAGVRACSPSGALIVRRRGNLTVPAAAAGSGLPPRLAGRASSRPSFGISPTQAGSAAVPVVGPVQMTTPRQTARGPSIPVPITPVPAARTPALR